MTVYRIQRAIVGWMGYKKSYEFQDSSALQPELWVQSNSSFSQAVVLLIVSTGRGVEIFEQWIKRLSEN